MRAILFILFAIATMATSLSAQSEDKSSPPSNANSNSNDADGYTSTTGGVAQASPQASAPSATSLASKASSRQLAMNVRRALSKTQQLNVSNITVRARGGTVTLSGSVPEGKQIEQAGEVAKGVAGVNSVSNKLNIQQQ